MRGREGGFSGCLFVKQSSLLVVLSVSASARSSISHLSCAEAPMHVFLASSNSLIILLLPLPVPRHQSGVGLSRTISFRRFLDVLFCRHSFLATWLGGLGRGRYRERTSGRHTRIDRATVGFSCKQPGEMITRASFLCLPACLCMRACDALHKCFLSICLPYCIGSLPVRSA